MTNSAHIGIVLSTVTAAPLREFVDIARLAETHGYDYLFVNEGRGDALACAQAIAMSTEHINTGTNIANIYFRHPFLLTSTARTIAELGHGRFVLGLGISHRALLSSLDIDMGDARARLAEYTQTVRQGLQGDLGSGFLKLRASAHHVPVYVAGNTVESAALAGQYGDGIMPFLSPLGALPTLLDAARDATEKRADLTAPFACILSIPTFLSGDTDAARSAARYNLAFFAQLPNYRRQWRRGGFGAAMDAAQRLWASGNRHDVAAQIPDELIDAVCVYGDPNRCRRQLQAFRDAGVDVPLLAVSPVNDERLAATKQAIEALAPTASTTPVR